MSAEAAKANALPFPKTRPIRLDRVFVDASYQRSLDQPRVSRMIKNFDPNLCAPLIVNEHDDGTFSVADGQHRLFMLRGVGITHYDCFVISVSKPVEAKLFVQHQTEHKMIATMERHRALVVALDPVACLLEDIVKSLGLKMGIRPEVGKVVAIAALYRVYAHGHVNGDAEEHVRRVLRVLKGAWGLSPLAYAAPFLHGMSYIIYAFPKVSQTELVERLQVHDPRSMLNQIRSDAQSSQRASTVAAVVMINRMNKGKKSRRLDPVAILTAADNIKRKGHTARGVTKVTARRPNRNKR